MAPRGGPDRKCPSLLCQLHQKDDLASSLGGLSPPGKVTDVAGRGSWLVTGGYIVLGHSGSAEISLSWGGMAVVPGDPCTCDWPGASRCARHAERYTYVPLIGLLIMMAWVIPDILGVALSEDRSCRIGRLIACHFDRGHQVTGTKMAR